MQRCYATPSLRSTKSNFLIEKAWNLHCRLQHYSIVVSPSEIWRLAAILRKDRRDRRTFRRGAEARPHEKTQPWQPTVHAGHDTPTAARTTAELPPGAGSSLMMPPPDAAMPEQSQPRRSQASARRKTSQRRPPAGTVASRGCWPASASR